MKRAHITEVRQRQPQDIAFLSTCAWIAFDSTGRVFGGDSEAQVRELCEQYNHPTHAGRERGRVAHPGRR